MGHMGSQGHVSMAAPASEPTHPEQPDAEVPRARGVGTVKCLHASDSGPEVAVKAGGPEGTL